MSAIYKSEEGQRLVESRYHGLLKRWPVPSEQRSISTSFGDTFVVTCGTTSMPPVVLLQGSGANAAMWLSDVATLSAAHRVYCVDVIGEPGFSAPSRARLEDALLDSEGTRRRLVAQVAQATVRMLPDAGHVIRGETDAIKAFLAGGCQPAAHAS